MSYDLLVIGGGRMGTALVRGLVSSGWSPSRIAVLDTDESQRESLSAILDSIDVLAEPRSAQGVVLAVKPLAAQDACKSAKQAQVGRALSIMAGVPISKLQQWLGPGVAVVRSMPNTPALVGKGMSVVSAGDSCTEQDTAWARSILQAVGDVLDLPEALLDAVTAVSGSGPAYFFSMVEALAAAGERVGLSRDVSRALARATFAGSALLLAESALEPEELRAQVTSPGGTTAAALALLEAEGWGEVLARAVAAAEARSKELGNSPF